MDFYDVIQKRHSVRSYQPYQMTDIEKRQVESVFKGLICIHQDNLLNWNREENPQSSGRIWAKHEMPPEDYLIEYGFQGEQIILSLVDMGFDTLWKAAGIPSDIPAYLIFGKGKAKKSIKEKVMGLFVNSGDRKETHTFLETNPELLNKSQMKIVKSCIRAPSAINRQPWKFHFQDTKTLEIRVAGRSKYNYLDMGICLYHAYQAFAIEFGTPEIVKKDDFLWIVKSLSKTAE